MVSDKNSCMNHLIEYIVELSRVSFKRVRMLCWNSDKQNIKCNASKKIKFGKPPNVDVQNVVKKGCDKTHSTNLGSCYRLI